MLTIMNRSYVCYWQICFWCHHWNFVILGQVGAIHDAGRAYHFEAFSVYLRVHDIFLYCLFYFQCLSSLWFFCSVAFILYYTSVHARENQMTITNEQSRDTGNIGNKKNKTINTIQKTKCATWTTQTPRWNWIFTRYKQFLF